MKASLSVLLLLLLTGAGDTPSLDLAVASIPNRNPSHVAPCGDDAEFLRRLSLDLIGYPPNGEQAAAFLGDPSADKRAKKIDELLAMPRFADFWARRYAEVFFGNYHEPAFDVAPGLKIETRRRLLTNFIAWLRDQIREDRPWPEIVTEMITARGNTATVPQLAYKLSFTASSGRSRPLPIASPVIFWASTSCAPVATITPSIAGWCWIIMGSPRSIPASAPTGRSLQGGKKSKSTMPMAGNGPSRASFRNRSKLFPVTCRRLHRGSGIGPGRWRS